MNANDPKLTSYALNELPEEQRAMIEQSLLESPEAQAALKETRALAEALRAEFKGELSRLGEETRNVLPLDYGRMFWSEQRWSSLAIAAAIVSAFCLAGVLLWQSTSLRRPVVAARSDSASGEFTIEAEDGGLQPPSGTEPQPGERPFVTTSQKPTTTFPLRVGGNSYQRVKELISSGMRPPKELVRTEQLVNAFNYDYPTVAAGQTLGITADAAPCPWQTKHLLVRVGVKFRDTATASRVTDAGLAEVEFNKERVESYRLIGFEEGPQSQSGASAIAQKDSVTVLYELAVRQAGSAVHPPNYLLHARVRTGETELGASSVAMPVSTFESAPADFRFAAAVAAFGMVLRDSQFKGSADLAAIIAWATDAQGSDPQGERAAFLECAKKAQALAL